MKPVISAAVFFLTYYLSTSPLYAQVIINEISPASDPEWVELYNNSDQEINLEGWEVADDETSTGHFNVTITQEKQNPVISGHSFLVVEGGTSGLSNTSDMVFLYDQSNNIIDQYFYEKGKTNKTFSRIPDGNGQFTANTDPTPNSPNQAPIIVSTSTPTPTPTSAVASTITPSSTPKPASTLTPIPTAKIIVTPTPTFDLEDPDSSSSSIDLVLGELNSLPQSSDPDQLEQSLTETDQPKLPLWITFTGAGILLGTLGFSAYQIYRRNQPSAKITQ